MNIIIMESLLSLLWFLKLYLFQPVIMFAGEATHRLYYRTTQGAMLSGIREAKRIMKSGTTKLSLNVIIVLACIALKLLV